MSTPPEVGGAGTGVFAALAWTRVTWCAAAGPPWFPPWVGPRGALLWKGVGQGACVWLPPLSRPCLPGSRGHCEASPPVLRWVPRRPQPPWGRWEDGTRSHGGGVLTLLCFLALSPRAARASRLVPGPPGPPGRAAGSVDHLHPPGGGVGLSEALRRLARGSGCALVIPVALCPSSAPGVTPDVSRRDRTRAETWRRRPALPSRARRACFRRPQQRQESRADSSRPGAPAAGLPLKGVLALSPEEVDVGLELELEDVLLVDAVGLLGDAHAVAQQREAGQGVVVLRGGTWLCGCALPAGTDRGAPGERVASRDTTGSAASPPRLCRAPLPDEFCRRTNRNW